MIDQIESLLKILNEYWGLSEYYTKPILYIFIVISLLVSIFKLLLWLYKKYSTLMLKKHHANDFHPYLTIAEVEKYTRLYIPQRYQNISSTDGDEPSNIYVAAASSKLMPLFLKKGGITQSNIKYYLILSDTGMGKTAFLINFLIKFKLRIKKIGDPNYCIKYIPLASNNSIEEIKNIQNKENTILLLDALDEDIHAIKDYKARMEEILSSVTKFRKIILTCRTQFFSNKLEEPHETNDLTFGDNIKLEFKKLYLSPFEKVDILKYLFKKFQLNFIKLYKSYKIVNKSPNLMIRPMLLSYIDDLIKVKVKYKYSFEIYQVLIDKWIEREIHKPAIQSKKSPSDYSYHLKKFSNNLATNLYENRESRNGYIIGRDELRELLKNSTLDTSIFTLDDHTGRSLLNRNSKGGIKFAHKSILEYILASHMFNNFEFMKKFNFDGMDATKNFITEMIHSKLIKLNGYYFESNDYLKQKNISNLSVGDINKLKKLIILNSNSIEPVNIAGLTECNEIYLIDEKYSFIYFNYLIIYIDNLSKNPSMMGVNKNIFNQIKDKFEPFISKINKPRITQKGYLKKLIENTTISPALKSEFDYFLNLPDLKPINNDDIQRIFSIYDLLTAKTDSKIIREDMFKHPNQNIPQKFGRINVEEYRLVTIEQLKKLMLIEKLAEINPNTGYYF